MACSQGKGGGQEGGVITKPVPGVTGCGWEGGRDGT